MFGFDNTNKIIQDYKNPAQAGDDTNGGSANRAERPGITLASTWNPRGELPRLERFSPLLHEVYPQGIIVLPPETGREISALLESLGWQPVIPPDWSWGRYLALQKAVDTGSGWIHYVDMDRLLRWVETRPEEWLSAVEQLPMADCVCFGRTPGAYATHPKSLLETEKSSNAVISHLLGRTMDISAGSKSFSQRAAQFLAANTYPGASMGMDAAWLVLLNRAGYQIRYVEVDGLDWESADQYKTVAANPEQQQQAAAVYDADPKNWEWRAKVAAEVIDTGLQAASQTIDEKWLSPSAHFEVHDYLHFYRVHLTEERADTEVDRVVAMLDLDQPADILDLACGYGRHTNRLARLGHHMTGIDKESGFLELARTKGKEMGVSVDYQVGDMRDLPFKARFDIILLLFTAFGYFNDDENQAVLDQISRSLRAEGRFLMDIPNREPFVAHFSQTQVDEVGQDIMLNRSSYDSQSLRWNNRRVVIRNGVRKDKPFFVRLYDLVEITSMLEQSGLEVEKVYSGWSMEPFSSDSNRMIIIARKPVSASISSAEK